MTVEEPREILLFRRLQKRLMSPLDHTGGPGPGTVVIVPSFTLDQAEMTKIPGVMHYEERLLAFLQLLREPGRRLVYVTSLRLPDTVVDYALGLVRSVSVADARQRLTLLDCADGGPEPLTYKILRRPDVVRRMRDLVSDPMDACILAFNGSPGERTLAVRLGVPLYACDPDLSWLGSKSGAREVFRASGVAVPQGVEGVRDGHDLVKALTELRRAEPATDRAVVKLNESFGAGGNAMFDFRGAPCSSGVENWIRAHIHDRIEFATSPESWEGYADKLGAMGGVVERFVGGAEVRSPSVQVEAGPGGAVRVMSTQDQMFAGAARQTYRGCTFPALPAYRRELRELATRTARTLAGRGAVGFASMDFVSVRAGGDWQHYAVDLNLRMGGGTAPLMFLHTVTAGRYRAETGDFVTPEGEPRYYFACDRLEHPRYRGLEPGRVIDAARRGGLLFDGGRRRGVVFHMLGALSGFGKCGAVVIERSPEAARRGYERVVSLLDGLVSPQGARFGEPTRNTSSS